MKLFKRVLMKHTFGRCASPLHRTIFLFTSIIKTGDRSAASPSRSEYALTRADIVTVFIINNGIHPLKSARPFLVNLLPRFFLSHQPLRATRRFIVVLRGGKNRTHTHSERLLSVEGVPRFCFLITHEDQSDFKNVSNQI